MIRLNCGYRTDLSTDLLILFICTIGCVFGPKTVAEGKREFRMYTLDHKRGRRRLPLDAQHRSRCFFFALWYIRLANSELVSLTNGRSPRPLGRQRQISCPSTRENGEELKEEERNDKSKERGTTHVLLMLILRQVSVFFFYCTHWLESLTGVTSRESFLPLLRSLGRADVSIRNALEGT